MSDEIGDDYLNWKRGSVFIHGSTGCGKTTFIFDVLAKQNVPILYVGNRTSLIRQLKTEYIKKLNIEFPTEQNLDDIFTIGNITFITYQKLAGFISKEHYLHSISNQYHNYIFQNQNNQYLWEPFSHELLQQFNNKSIFLDTTIINKLYEYVVFDEYHYFLQDSLFNEYIDFFVLSYISRYNFKVRIYISATPDEIYPMIKSHSKNNYLKNPYGFPAAIYNYNLQKNFKENISKPVYSYKGNNQLLEIIKYAPKEDKWLIFLNNINEGNELKKLLKANNISCRFIHSKNEKSNTKTITEIYENKTFSEKCLITTSYLDNGISIHDKNLRHIVIDTFDYIEFMQMIGRKRFSDNEEKINLYVAERSFKELKAYYEKNIIRKLNVMLEAARAIQTNNIDFFIEKYFNTSDFKNLISLKKQKLYVNNLAYAKLNNLYIFYQNILNKASARKYNNISSIVYNHYFKTYENMNGIIYNRRLQSCTFKPFSFKIFHSGKHKQNFIKR